MATRVTKVPAIPDLGSTSLDQVVLAIKQWIDTRQGSIGDGLDRAVTLRDLVAAGALDPAMANSIAAGVLSPNPPVVTVTDPAVPPTPTQLTATGAITSILLTWTFAVGYSRLSHFEVWRSATDAIGDAVLISQPRGAIWADPVAAGDAFYYWVRAVSDAGTSPYNSVAGTLGQTSVNNQQVQDAINSSIDASGLLDQLTIKTSPDGLVSGYGLASTPSADNGSATTFAVLADRFLVGAPAANGIVPVVPFVVQTTPTVVNGVPVAKGVYIADAFVVNGSITNAKIGNLAVDDAKIANVSVAKLLAGQLSVTEYIESSGFLSGVSGFHINGSGVAEFNQVVVRGGVYATYGAIGGNIIDSTGVKSASYSPGFAGWRIDSGGNVEFNAGVFRGTLEGVDGTFSGALSAATGTFAGEVEADALTASLLNVDSAYARTANIVDGAITTAKIGLAQVGRLQLSQDAYGSYLEYDVGYHGSQNYYGGSGFAEAPVIDFNYYLNTGFNGQGLLTLRLYGWVSFSGDLKSGGSDPQFDSGGPGRAWVSVYAGNATPQSLVYRLWMNIYRAWNGYATFNNFITGAIPVRLVEDASTLNVRVSIQQGGDLQGKPTQTFTVDGVVHLSLNVLFR